MGIAHQRWGSRLLDRLIASDQPDEIRAQLLQTVLQRRPALILSSTAIGLMSLSAALLLRNPWAIGWLALDLLLIGYRLFLSIRYEPADAPAPEWEVRRVMGLSLAIFGLLGIGAFFCFRSGAPLLALIGTISVMGLVGGLVSRWAAFPRLGLATMAAVGLLAAAGLATAPDPAIRPAALQLLLIVAGTAALTVQNHRTLLAMLLARAEAARLAATDALTRLPNRAQLVETLRSRCDAPGAFALLFLDLDGFKSVNDRDGHAAGDAMLQAVGAALAQVEGGAAHRIGGDEFVLIVPGGATEAGLVAARTSEAVSVAGQGRIGASIGVALAPEDGRDPDRLMTRADHALYVAKRAGRGRTRFWREVMLERVA
ncbi:GGDEF domain-containing protein [Sphingomonas jatrophae]|uniref:diguanylate cyclase n=1 Tax=Sphingomonas jatrophae TaxID=1166337 RepID=A0A1I6JMY0_9SPHN|nr:GGDEF domain-containing protein [Sphingomonas jatrophae]SFR80251.1 diguanylate cyclase (GGDEF) domain-containing protein [Sphingomonas jatrophae]